MLRFAHSTVQLICLSGIQNPLGHNTIHSKLTYQVPQYTLLVKHHNYQERHTGTTYKAPIYEDDQGATDQRRVTVP